MMLLEIQCSGWGISIVNWKGGSEEFLCVGMQIKSVNRTICYPRRGQACRVEEKNGWIEIESTNRERKEEGRRFVGLSSFLSILNPSPHFPLVLLAILSHPSIGKVIIIVIISSVMAKQSEIPPYSSFAIQLTDRSFGRVIIIASLLVLWWWQNHPKFQHAWPKFCNPAIVWAALLLFCDCT